MTPSKFLDTNILLYSISPDPAEREKRIKASELLDLADIALSVQTLQEFYVQAIRPKPKGALTHDMAVSFIHAWTRFPVQAMTVAVLQSALDIKARTRFSYWDSAIIAAAVALGCTELYTEDMSHGREVDGVTIINPFR